MTEPSDNQIAEWAQKQLSDYDNRTPGLLFADGLTLTIPEAYALQTTVADLRVARGEHVVGYKVGCTSETIRRQLSINHCVTGRLFDSERHRSGVILSRSEFATPAIEGELAVELERAPSDADFQTDGIPSCVASIFPVIELHHRVMRGAQPTAAELIANNAINGGFVAGNPAFADDFSPGCLRDAGLSIQLNGGVIDEYSGPQLVHTINSSLKWLHEMMRDRGERLEAGQVILTGSVPALHTIEENCEIRVDSRPLGSVHMTFTS